jgi:hypothetical protein
MPYISKHKAEKLFVTGKDTIIFPLSYTPYSVTASFIDAEAVKLPGCNPVSNDTVTATIIKLPQVKRGVQMSAIQVSWSATGTREIEWQATELTG